MTAIKSPTTGKPGSEFTLTQTVASILAGCVLRAIHHQCQNLSSIVSTNLPFYTLAAWQVTCGFALIFEQSKVYGASSIKQAARVAELAGVAWLLFGFLAVVASREGGGSPSSMTASCVLWSCVAFNVAFSVVAGPLRLTPANPNEKWLVPVNTALVAWTAAALLLSE